MPEYVVFQAIQGRSLTDQNEPIGYTLLTQAFRRVVTADQVDPSVARSLGHGLWIGPGPRVVRTAYWVPPSMQTSAVWLMEFPDAPAGADPAAVQQWRTDRISRVREQLTTNLNDWARSEGWTVGALAYNPNVNGTKAWWESGQAVNTRTRDRPNAGAQTNDDYENPLGPTTPQTTPPVIRPPGLPDPNAAVNAAERAAKALQGVLVAGAVLVGLVYLAPVASRALEGLSERSRSRRAR